tara:strand:- start:452 stop:784 length:333 start_codon:yes stop_codon:yes gene_type:complete
MQDLKSFKEIHEELSSAFGAGTSSTSIDVGYDKPLFNKKGKKFDVSSDVFRRFQTGRNKFERWSKFLNLEDSNQKAIYDYAIRNRDATVILRDSETGAMRAIRPRSSNRL